MSKSPRSILTLAGVLTLTISSLAIIPQTVSAAGADAAEQGKKIAFDRKKGNCLACHEMAGGTLPGNIGPALVEMKSRYPDKAALRKQIWDATAANPNTIMPPFGKHQILTEQELDLVVEFVNSL